MHFRVSKAAISTALTQLARIVERRNTIPILSNVAMIAEKGVLTLKATDLDIEAVTSIGIDSITDGALTVAAVLAADVVRKMNGDTIEFVASEREVTVKAGRSKFSLQSLPLDDMPTLLVGSFTNTFDIERSKLKAALSKVSFAMSTEETRYYLCGVYMHIRGTGELTFVATDGHRLAKYMMNAPDGAEGMPGIILPRKTVAELSKMLDGEGTVTVSVSTSKIRFDFGTSSLTSKLIDGVFPDYDRVIPAKQGTTVMGVETKSLTGAVDRVATISSERGRGVKFTLTSGSLHLLTQNPDSGCAEDEVAIDYDRDEMSIGFNAKYVNELLSHVGGSTTLFFLSDSASPAIIEAQGDESTTFVLMPMRI